jgi:hypothetical protein
MVQTYQGYFQEGRFISSNTNDIPDFVEVYIVVTNKTVPMSNSIIKKLKARGIFNNCANVDMIKGEKGAWERTVVENYAKDNS